jgi:hypothetical protein
MLSFHLLLVSQVVSSLQIFQIKFCGAYVFLISPTRATHLANLTLFWSEINY